MNKHCDCGEIYQEYCESDEEPTVYVDWVPPAYRGTARAAEHCDGLWQRLRLTEDCADNLRRNLNSTDSSESMADDAEYFRFVDEVR